MWNALIEHARTCDLSEKLYVYYPDDSRIVGVVFNNIYELRGLVDNDQYFPEDSLSDSQKVDVDTWVKKAYANWNQIVEYEGKPLLNFKQTKESSTSQSDPPLVPVNHSHTSDNQLPPWRLPVSVPFGPSSVDQSMLVGGSGSGSNDSMTQLLNSNTCSQFEPASSTQQANLTNQIKGTSYGNGVGVALSPSFEFALSPSLLSEFDFAFAASPSRSLPFDSSIQQDSVNPFEYQYFHNDQYKISSFISGDVNHQIPGNEDMQHSLANDISTDNASLAVPEVKMLRNNDMQFLLGNEFSVGNAYGGFSLSPSHLSPLDFDFALSPSHLSPLDFDFALSPSHFSPLDFDFALSPSRSLPFDSSIQQASVNPFGYQYCHVGQYEIFRFVSGDVSHQILGNEDMQHSLVNDVSTNNASLAAPEVVMLWNNDMQCVLEKEFGNISLTVSQKIHTKKNMQQLVPNFGMGGHASVNVPEEDFNFPSCMSSQSHGLSSGTDEVVFGRLKIKAGSKSGIIIRETAAARKDQLVELYDE